MTCENTHFRLLQTEIKAWKCSDDKHTILKLMNIFKKKKSKLTWLFMSFPVNVLII